MNSVLYSALAFFPNAEAVSFIRMGTAYMFNVFFSWGHSKLKNSALSSGARIENLF